MVAMYGTDLFDFFSHTARPLIHSFLQAALSAGLVVEFLGTALWMGARRNPFAHTSPIIVVSPQGLNVCFRGRDGSRFGVLGRVGVWSGISG